MSEIVNRLRLSKDPVERAHSHTLTAWVNAKAARGEARRLGREPAAIKKNGSVATIEARVINGSDGFDQVPAEDSYEAIVDQYPEHFTREAVSLARQRLEREREHFAPTADKAKFEKRVAELRSRQSMKLPAGSQEPERREVTSVAIVRDPAVKAYVLKLAGGLCELCLSEAPFIDQNGCPFLEVHHVRPLAEGGSDRVSNLVAVCPNCHRAVHLSSDAEDLVANLYRSVSRLIPE